MVAETPLPADQLPACYRFQSGEPDLGVDVASARKLRRRGGNRFVKPPVAIRRIPTGRFTRSGRQDLNLRPLGPQPSALPDCATPRGCLHSDVSATTEDSTRLDLQASLVEHLFV